MIDKWIDLPVSDTPAPPAHNCEDEMEAFGTTYPSGADVTYYRCRVCGAESAPTVDWVL